MEHKFSGYLLFKSIRRTQILLAKTHFLRPALVSDKQTVLQVNSKLDSHSKERFTDEVLLLKNVISKLSFSKILFKSCSVR